MVVLPPLVVEAMRHLVAHHRTWLVVRVRVRVRARVRVRVRVRVSQLTLTLTTAPKLPKLTASSAAASKKGGCRMVVVEGLGLVWEAAG